MKLFQWTITRRFSCYKKVVRPEGYKVVSRSPNVPLPKVLDMRIKAGGPIKVADYMKLVATNPQSGYYVRRRDPIGKTGDFITSPEISQLFGEMIAVWIISELTKIGSPRPLQLIELGPGRGTLMKDILRVFKHFKYTENISVHLVEVSPNMASLQCIKLCEEDSFTIGDLTSVDDNPHYKAKVTPDEIPVHWYSKIEKVPKAFSVVLAHEFFDALPINKYQRVDGKWREVLIDSKLDESGDFQFNYVLSKEEPPLSKLLIKENDKRDHLEVCVESLTIAKHIADRLEEDGGIALFVDYGHTGEKTDTFRAFKNHELHDPLVDPGSADLTADVDFSMLKDVMKDKLVTFGPINQGDFLTRLGIEIRLQNLREHISEECLESLESGYHMIVDKDQMGTRYKCFAAFPLVLKDHLERFPVCGFSDATSVR